MLSKDIRYAIRSLVRSKGFTTAAVLCLGFGIGLNATIFSIMDGVLLKPYPYADPDRLLVVGTGAIVPDAQREGQRGKEAEGQSTSRFLSTCTSQPLST